MAPTPTFATTFDFAVDFVATLDVLKTGVQATGTTFARVAAATRVAADLAAAQIVGCTRGVPTATRWLGGTFT